MRKEYRGGIMELLIKGAKIVDSGSSFIGDIYIKNGFIDEIGLNLNIDCKTIYANGLTLMPSFVDLHVHFRDPGYTYKEDIESGSRAAVRGGYTAVNLMANTNPVCSTMETVDYVLEKSQEIALVDVHQSVSITRNFDGKDISHIDNLKPSVRIISEDGKDVMDSKVMLDAMVKAKEKNITVMCHCENHDFSSTDMRLAENTMTWRNVTLAGFTGCKTHIAHVSTKESMEYIIQEKKKNFRLTCEVTPHHIALCNDIKYAVNPPLRETEDICFIIDCIKNGYVDTISTDHAPHSSLDKEKGAPGISGLETAFAVCYTKLVKQGHINLNTLSKMMSEKPALIAGFNKGRIAIGFDGDVVLVDTEESFYVDSKDFRSKGKNTPFDGMKFYGKVVTTIKGGRVVFEEASIEEVIA